MSNEHPKKILVVDDQGNWRKILQTLLQKEGYDVQVNDNFDDAKFAILKTRIDLLILDLRLVDEDIFNVQGLELLKLAKSQEKSPFVIILTGYPEILREGVLVSLGADALMFKVPPGGRFDSQDFKQQVRNLLS